MNMLKDDDKLIALSSMSLGQKALIVAFSFDTREGERIQKMGLVPGEKLEIVRQPLPEGTHRNQDPRVFRFFKQTGS